jgi:hypothetical protein
MVFMTGPQVAKQKFGNERGLKSRFVVQGNLLFGLVYVIYTLLYPPVDVKAGYQ